jgi:hypothetical protein
VIPGRVYSIPTIENAYAVSPIAFTNGNWVKFSLLDLSPSPRFDIMPCFVVIHNGSFAVHEIYEMPRQLYHPPVRQHLLPAFFTTMAS